MNTTRRYALHIAVAMAGAALAACTHRPVGTIAAPAPAGTALPAATTPAQPIADADGLRERMRTIVKVHCGTCHQSTLPTAKPAALAIHDLDSPEWPSTLSRAQLEGGFTRRLNARLDEEGKSLLRTFVAAEAAKR